MPTDGDTLLNIESSALGRRWVLRPTDERMADAIRQQQDVPEAVARILAQRGLTPETAERFLNPQLKTELPDPSCLQDMDKAAARLAEAVLNNEKIAVFGDYDVDGATSSALLIRFFRMLGVEILSYIPDRLSEGYGPNEAALLALKEQGAKVIVTVDCGTLAYDPLAAAKAADIDVIIADHHKAETRLPECHSLVNPNRLDDESELGHLAAVGVSFVLAVAVTRTLRNEGYFRDRKEPDLIGLLDLVALGTVCDVVPLTGLNRAFVTQGLKVMARRQNIGMRTLGDVAGLDKAPEAYHCGFLLGPRVNAGGRVGEASLGTRLLSTEDGAEALKISETLHHLNKERQALEAEVLDAALADLLQECGPTGRPFPICLVAGEGWHPGVIGIVASRLTDRFGLPSLVIALDGGKGKGSARSIPGVDIGTAILEAQHQGLIEKGGGHSMAAGLSLQAEQVAPLKDFLADWLSSRVSAAERDATTKVDAVLSMSGANAELVDAMNALAPFGQGNPAPRIVLNSVSVEKVDIVGETHVRVFLRGRDGGRMKGMAFRAADQILGQSLFALQGKSCHILGRLKRDDWRGGDVIEIHIEDVATA